MSAESRWAAVARLGQSIWYDNVARPALADGHLAQLVERDHVTGGTSNPSIFAKAVSDSELYDVAVADIQDACDLFLAVWERTGGQDGYVSLEEEASIAFDVAAGEDVSAIASVASFFVSRIDAKADAALPEDSPLRGQTAIANARLAYDAMLEAIAGQRQKTA
jgi:transaldolase